MKLSFVKNTSGDISVRFKCNNKYEVFSYPEMVKKMYDEKSVEMPELIGNFTEKEKESIYELIQEFQTAITESNQSTD